MRLFRLTLFLLAFGLLLFVGAQTQVLSKEISIVSPSPVSSAGANQSDFFSGNELNSAFSWPWAMVMFENKLYVVNNWDGTLSVIDLNSSTLKARLPIFARDLVDIAINKKTKKIYCLASTSNLVVVLDIAKINEIISGKTGLDPISARIPVEKNPQKVIINEKTNTVYTINRDSQSVSVIDGATNKVKNNFKPSFGNNPATFAEIDPDTGILYIPNYKAGELAVLNTQTGDSKNVKVGASPVYVKLDKELGRIYIANSLDDTISVLDSSKLSLIKEVPTGGDPEFIDFNSSSNKIYVINYLDSSLSVIDRQTLEVIKKLELGSDVYVKKLAIDPGLNKVYLASYGNDRVLILDGKNDEITKTLDTGANPTEVAVDQQTHKAYVLNTEGDSLLTIDGATNEGKIYPASPKAGENSAFPVPYSMIIDEAKNLVFVANSVGTITVVDGNTKKFVKTIEVGKNGRGMEVNTVSNKVYISLIGESAIAVISEKDFSVKKIEVGERPRMLRYDAKNNRLYVDNFSGNSISVVDGSSDKLIDTVAVGERPTYTALDANLNKLFVANFISNNVSVIDLNTNKVIKTIDVGRRPDFMKLDSAVNKLYVAKSGNDEINVINTLTLEKTDSLSGGFSVTGMVLLKNENVLGIANGIDKTVSLVNLATKKLSVVVLTGRPSALSYFAGSLYAPMFSGAVAVINVAEAKVMKELSLGGFSAAMALNTKTQELYVANTKGSSLSVFDLKQNKQIATITEADSGPVPAIQLNNENNGLGNLILYAVVVLVALAIAGASLYFLKKKKSNLI